MAVIAMTREMGTLGKEVAARVAQALGVEVVHHELVERHLAQKLQISETAVHRFLEGEASLWERWRIDSRQLSRATAEEVLLLAGRGDVLIRGWGAAQLLRDIQHVLCVRICAPLSFRTAEMSRRLGVDERAARREIERSDTAHDRTVRTIFNTDWRDATGYAAVLNTGRMSVETASDLLLQLARSPHFAVTEESRSRLDDKLVLARVREALGAAGAWGAGLDLKVKNGIVTVSGALVAGEDVEGTIETIKAVEGVRMVENQVHMVPFSYGA